MDVMQAAANVADDFRGGARALAVECDKNATTFAHELHETGGAKLGLKTALKMTKRSGDLRILLAFAAECGQMCMPLPNHVDPKADACMLALGEMFRETSEVGQELCKSLGDDGDINDNELARIEREASELVAAVQRLLVTAQARNQAGKRHTAASSAN